MSDASRAIHSMLLVAWSEGVGSNWVGFGGLEKINALLGIPGELDVLAILPFGYPADRIGRGRKDRKPLRAIAHRERYGQPFEYSPVDVVTILDPPLMPSCAERRHARV